MRLLRRSRLIKGMDIYNRINTPEEFAQAVKYFQQAVQLDPDFGAFTSLAQARVAIALWRAGYNTARPHSQIAWQTPAEFASTFNPRRSLALRYAKGSAPAPVASPTQQGTTHAGNELKTG